VRGDLVSVPGGAGRAFTNVTGTPARQLVYIQSAHDAAAFYDELGHACRPSAPPADKEAFGKRWGIVFLTPPLKARDAEVSGGLD